MTQPEAPRRAGPRDLVASDRFLFTPISVYASGGGTMACSRLQTAAGALNRHEKVLVVLLLDGAVHEAADERDAHAGDTQANEHRSLLVTLQSRKHGGIVCGRAQVAAGPLYNYPGGGDRAASLTKSPADFRLCVTSPN